MSFENIVRPAQLPNNQPPRRGGNNRTVQNWAPVILKWGIGGGVTQAGASESETLTLYQIQRPTEKQSGGSLTSGDSGFATSSGDPIFSTAGSGFGGGLAG